MEEPFPHPFQFFSFKRKFGEEVQFSKSDFSRKNGGTLPKDKYKTSQDHEKKSVKANHIG